MRPSTLYVNGRVLVQVGGTRNLNIFHDPGQFDLETQLGSPPNANFNKPNIRVEQFFFWINLSTFFHLIQARHNPNIHLAQNLDAGLEQVLKLEARTRLKADWARAGRPLSPTMVRARGWLEFGFGSDFMWLYFKNVRSMVHKPGV